MSSDNVAIVRALIEALNRLDLDAYLELCHEDVGRLRRVQAFEDEGAARTAAAADSG